MVEDKVVKEEDEVREGLTLQHYWGQLMPALLLNCALHQAATSRN